MPNRVWTPEEDEIIRTDRANRVKVPVTAAKLNRPVPATYLRARKLGTLVQQHVSWSPEDEHKLRQLLEADPPLTAKELSAELGRSVESLRWKMAQLGLIGIRDLDKLQKKLSARRPPSAGQKVAKRAAPKKAFDRTIRDLVKGVEKQFAKALAERTRANAADRRDADRQQKKIKKEIDRKLLRSALDHQAAIKKAAARAAKAKPGPNYRSAPKKPACGSAVRLPKIKDISGATKAAHAQHVRSKEERQPFVVALEPVRAPNFVDPKPTPTPRKGFQFAKRNSTRSDALELASAASAAVARFISDRGVTRGASDEAQELVSRLQRRGYVVLRKSQDHGGAMNWIVDGRHHLDTVEALRKFAEARGHA